MSEEKDNKTEFGKLSRREFLRDAGIVVGGTAVSSAFFLSACGKEVEVTKTVTTTAPGTTSTITKTAPGTTSTVTTTAAGSTQTITKYTCPIDGQEFDSLSALKAHFDTVHGGEGGTINKLVSLTVNGHHFILQVKPEETMQDILRKQLGLTSPKDMCFGQGACGSCSVIINGRPVLSCMTLAIECNDAIVETAEGFLAQNHPIIESYIKYAALQCGFCTPGFVVTAKALLDKKPNPTESDIREALGGNICRCGSYPAHIPAVLAAADKLGGA
ncbi:MAG: (2Fe-2S)-binding protein [Dehalococcoidales bacterium]|nr:(2Fe-2S)-binding protein [Dehalococcoidales bacterium]